MYKRQGLDTRLVNEPIFGSTRAPASGSGDSGSKLRVKLDAIVPELETALKKDRNIRLSARDYDVRVIQRGQGLALEHVTGGLISEGVLDQPMALSLLERLGEAQRVVGLTYPAQDFNVTLSVERVAQNSSETASSFKEGELLQISLTSDQPAYLIALNVDVEGRLTILYPSRDADLAPAARGQTVKAAVSTVEAPFGTEVLKVFAFREKPAGYDELLRTPQFVGQEAIRRFLSMVDGGPGGRAQTAEILFSQPTVTRRPQ